MSAAYPPTSKVTLKIVRIPKGVPTRRHGRDGWGQFPWNTYWRVLRDGVELAQVSTCDDFDKGVHVEDGALTDAERAAVCRALKVSDL